MNTKISNISILSFSQPSLSGVLKYSMIASSFTMNFKTFFSLIFNLSEKLATYGVQKQVIYYIGESETKSCVISDNRVLIIRMSGIDFFNIIYLENLFSKASDLKRSIFIFEDLPYLAIRDRFAELGISISGGSNNLKHNLSPIQLRLSKFILILTDFNDSVSIVGSSFHSTYGYIMRMNRLSSNGELLQFASKLSQKEKEAIREEIVHLKNKGYTSDYKQIVGPSENSKSTEDKTQTNFITKAYKNSRGAGQFQSITKNLGSRKLHTAITGTDNTKIKGLSIRSFLSSLELILNDKSLTPLDKQLAIENKWVRIEAENLKNNTYVLERHGHLLYDNIASTTQRDKTTAKQFLSITDNNIIERQIITCNDTLQIMYTNNYLRKKFPKIPAEELNNPGNLIVAYSLALAYMNNIKATKLYSIVGKAIIYRIYSLRMEKDLLKIPSTTEKLNMTFDVFLRNAKITDTDFIVLGDIFISIFTQPPHDIFSRDFSSRNFISHEGTCITINPEYLNAVRENIIIHPSTLPMVVEPNKWSNNYFGGYLQNETLGNSIITGSKIHKHSLKLRKPLYETVNYLSSIPFTINNLLLDYLQGDGQYILTAYQSNMNKEDILQNDLILRVAKLYSKLHFYLPVNAD